VLEFAEAQDWREGNQTLSKRKILKERRDPIVLPEPEQIEAVLAVTPARFGALVRAAEMTGCRQSELVYARWRDLNIRAQALEVVGKGNKRRVLSLSPEATAHFSAQPNRQA
jgi:integrase/recombinase XerD